MSIQPCSKLSAWLGAAALATLACQRQRAEEAPQGSAMQQGSAVQQPATAANARELPNASAFDLAASPRGAVLGWVSTGPTPALHVARFDAQGEAQGQTTQELTSATIGDLALADSAAGLSAIWREGNGAAAVARGAWLDHTGTSQRLELGSAWGDAPAGRGNLALVSRGAGALALVRGPRESCQDGSAEACFGFRFYRVSGSGAVETGLGLRVPVPCDAQAAQLLSPPPVSPGVSTADAGAGSEARLHYAVCTRAEQAPVLTVFSIEADRSYAAARQAFPGCSPLGAGYFGGQPLIVAECQGSRQAARIAGADAPLDLHSLDVRGLVCGARGARVRLGSEWLELDRPTDHLELLLDGSLTPSGARAVWTGSVLLVADAAGAHLGLRRYACAGSELRGLPSPLG